MEHFQYIGQEVTGVGTACIAVGVVLLGLMWFFRRVLSISGFGLVLVGIALSLIHAPSSVAIFLQFLAMGVGGFWDMKKIPTSCRRSSRLSRIAPMILFVAMGSFFVGMSIYPIERNFTLRETDLFVKSSPSDPYSHDVSFDRANLRVVKTLGYGSHTSLWEFKGGKETLPYVSEREFYIDSSGHILSGGDVASRIAAWAHVGIQGQTRPSKSFVGSPSATKI